ncbi:hypothetical protein DFR70_12714 [Nocardia tenerifensis]|uniref:Uncharacterized protein n=1 Tax=Nocardia tenerifensis TaxID=228006 RepID=A0A318JKR7_9NOCA|nr:hypothetical protein [Nocardia tenerifensis]PXX53403.1 hypothetical protein DFR70_12714 [Nocardia tenerifensis]
MADLAERLNDLRVHVRAPRAEIEAELRGHTGVTFSFGESVYGLADESRLALAMEAVGRLLRVGWVRQYREALDGTGLYTDSNDPQNLTFFADRANIVSVAESSDGRITISSSGMDSFSVDIKPGTVYELSADEFCASASEAATKLAQDFLAKVQELKKQHYQ